MVYSFSLASLSTGLINAYISFMVACIILRIDIFEFCFFQCNSLCEHINIFREGRQKSGILCPTLVFAKQVSYCS